MASEGAPDKEGLSWKKEETMGSKGKPADGSHPSDDDTAYGRINHLILFNLELI
jgi:hypothetical protein